MMVEANKDLIRRLVEESFNQKNLNLLDVLVDEHYIDHAPFPDQVPGVEGMKQVHHMFYQGFSDVQQTIDDLIAEGDRVVVRWTCFGTHDGLFLGIPPTGRYVSVTGIDIFQIVNGKVMECWHNVDAMGLMQQLTAAEVTN